METTDNKEIVEAINIDFPVADIFSEGVYARSVFMPKDSIVVGKLHKTRHLNFVMSGKAWVWMNGEKQYVEAPCIIESFENIRKVLYIEEDMYWTTVHPTDIKDKEEIEKIIIKEETNQEILDDLLRHNLLLGEELWHG